MLRLDESEVVCFENSRAQLAKKKKDAGHKTQFDTKWQQNCPWLKYSEQISEDGGKKGMMFCSQT